MLPCVYSSDGKSKSQQILSPEVIRVFTGLFLTVENLAEVLGVSQELMVETLSKEALHGWLEKGISNVAYISIALGLENMASNAFIEAKVKTASLSKLVKEVQPVLLLASI